MDGMGGSSAAEIVGRFMGKDYASRASIPALGATGILHADWRDDDLNAPERARLRHDRAPRKLSATPRSVGRRALPEAAALVGGPAPYGQTGWADEGRDFARAAWRAGRNCHILRRAGSRSPVLVEWAYMAR